MERKIIRYTRVSSHTQKDDIELIKRYARERGIDPQRYRIWIEGGV